MKRGFLTGLLAASLALLTLGCGADKDSASAQLEKAMMAMDTGRYADAIQYLDAICPDRNVCADHILTLIAEAQMGLSGVELANLISGLAAQTPGTTAAFDAINLLFGSGAIDALDVTNLADSLTTLQGVTPTPSSQLQTAIAAAAHLVAAITVAASPDGGVTYNPAGVVAALVTPVVADLTIVASNVAAVDASLGTGADLTADLNGLVADIEAAGGGTVNGTVELAELQAFVGLL
jgi:hypothetical protein